MENQNAENERSKTESDEPVNAAASRVSEPAVRGSMPDKLDLRVSLDSVPHLLAKAVENLAEAAKPESKFKTFFKDYLPALTPIATGIIAGMVSYYIYQSDHNRSKEALDKTLTEFGEKTDDRARAIAAIKLAAYGDQALPAVKMVLGADDVPLRQGGELVAEQMYRAETVKHEALITKMLSYYGANDPTLRLGVLEWLVKMGHQLSDEEGRRAFDILSTSFGSQGQNCAKQDNHVAMEAANFLLIWSFKDSKELLSGMTTKCADPDVRRQAQQALDAIDSSSPSP